MLDALAGQAGGVPVNGPPQLVDASNCTGEAAVGADGTNVNLGVGPCVGGRMMPSGINRISTDCGFDPTKFVPVADATMLTQLPMSWGCDVHPVNTPLVGRGGAI
jgi:hypothetical protein